MINKRDLVSDAALRTLRGWIAEIAPRTPILEAAHADVPFEALTGLAATPVHAGNASPIEHSTRFEAAVLPCDGRFSASIEGPPPGRAARVVAIGLRGSLPGEALRRELSLACLRPTPRDCTLATPTAPCFPRGGEHGS